MEKFREALHQLEVRAEGFDRLIGSDAIAQPSDAEVEELVAAVKAIHARLDDHVEAQATLRAPKPLRPPKTTVPAPKPISRPVSS